HSIIIDPPTADVTAHVLACLSTLRREKDHKVIHRSIRYLKHCQESDGAYYGAWGTNYIFGTSSVLVGLALAGIDLNQTWICKSIQWLISKQNSDGGWGETCETYHQPELRGTNNDVSIPEMTAWAIIALLSVGKIYSDTVKRGIN